MMKGRRVLFASLALIFALSMTLTIVMSLMTFFSGGKKITLEDKLTPQLSIDLEELTSQNAEIRPSLLLCQQEYYSTQLLPCQQVFWNFILFYHQNNKNVLKITKQGVFFRKLRHLKDFFFDKSHFKINLMLFLSKSDFYKKT